MLPTSEGVEPATSWSPVGRRIQLSHRDRNCKSYSHVFSKNIRIMPYLTIKVLTICQVMTTLVLNNWAPMVFTSGCSGVICSLCGHVTTKCGAFSCFVQFFVLLLCLVWSLSLTGITLLEKRDLVPLNLFCGLCTVCCSFICSTASWHWYSTSSRHWYAMFCDCFLSL